MISSDSWIVEIAGKTKKKSINFDIIHTNYYIYINCVKSKSTSGRKTVSVSYKNSIFRNTIVLCKQEI